MMDITVTDILVAVISLSSGIIVTYLGAVVKFRKDLEFDHDKYLRQERLIAYKELWKLTQPLAEYSSPGPITSEVARELSASLRRWYFENGGLLLTKNSRKSYFALQDKLKKILEQRAAPPATDYHNEIISYSHLLHDSLVDDIGTRMKPKIDTRK